MTKTIKLCLAFLPAVALLLTSAPAFAENGADDTTEVKTTSTQTETEHLKESQKAALLAAAKQKVCGAKRNRVGAIETKVGKRGQGRLDAITKIATKVENYVTNKNLTVANYTGLVSDIGAKKVIAQAAVDKVNSEVGKVGSVSCQGGDGKAQVEAFKADMRAQQDALKNYRQSVKALVAAVKTAKTATGGEQE